MKVAFLTQWYPPETGSAALPGVIATALQNRGMDVTVFTAFPNYPEGRLYSGWKQRWGHSERIGCVHVNRTPVYLSHDERALHRILNYLSFAVSATGTLFRKARDIDAVWVHGTPATAALPAMILRRLRGVPFVLHIQDLWPDTVVASGMLPRAVEPFIRKLLDWFCRLSYRQAAVIGIITPGMRATLTARGVPSDKIVDIPNWANEEIFRPGIDGSLKRRDLGLPATFTVMYAGAIGEVQGLDSFINAAALLRDHDIHFALVGDGVAKDSLQRLAEGLALTNVTFIPSQPLEEMSAVLASADVQLISLMDLPLYRITLPSKVQATLAAGRPMIVSAGGDAGDVVKTAGSGLAVAPGDPRALASAIQFASECGREDLASWGAAGRRHYEEVFSETYGAAKMIAALRRAHGTRKGRDT